MRPERADLRYVWHPFTQMSEWRREKPLVIRRARGAYLYDSRGRRYLDGVSSLWVTLHGHRHPAIDAAVRRQLSRVGHSTFLGLTHDPGARLAEQLIRIAPKGLTRVFYSDNGSTAVEVALKMAYQYWKMRGENRPEFLSLREAYHGDTVGSVSVGGIGLFHGIFRPLLFRVNFAMSPHCSECPFNRTGFRNRMRLPESPSGGVPRPGMYREETGCRWECLGEAEKILKRRGRRIAACVAEALVQAAAGMRVMPPGYMAGLQRICRRHGVLLVCDEVATGFGRTGTMFACEQEGVRPDFLCLAKSITAGYLPLAATLTTEKIFRAFEAPYERLRTFFHGHTYTANPLACAAALANLGVFQKEETLKKLKGKMELLRDLLEGLRRLPWVWETRQMGFLAGVELRRPDGKPFPLARRVGRAVCLECRKAPGPMAAILRPLGDTVVLVPPLSISEAQLRDLLRCVEWAIRRTLSRRRNPL